MSKDVEVAKRRKERPVSNVKWGLSQAAKGVVGIQAWAECLRGRMLIGGWVGGWVGGGGGVCVCRRSIAVAVARS